MVDGIGWMNGFGWLRLMWLFLLFSPLHCVVAARNCLSRSTRYYVCPRLGPPFLVLPDRWDASFSRGVMFKSYRIHVCVYVAAGATRMIVIF